MEKPQLTLTNDIDKSGFLPYHFYKMKSIKRLSRCFNLALICFFFLLFGIGIVSAQEDPVPFRFSIGLGAEGNKNAVEKTSVAGVLTNDFAINSHISIGSRLGFSYDLTDVGTLEAGIMFRVYFLSWNSSGPFIQADGGLSYIFWHDDMFREFLYGGTLGWRFHLGSFYIEPYGRGGYPFVWGGGLVLGISL
jgi:hypothetical protein